MSFSQNLGQSLSSVPVVGGTTQGIINAIDGAISSRRQYKNQKKLMGLQFDYQSQLQQKAYENSLEAWRLQNEYNDPSAVRDRLEKAGYNINAMSGVATPAGGLSSVSSPSVGLGQSSATSAGAFDVAAIRESTARARNLESQASLYDAQANTEVVRLGLLENQSYLVSLQSEGQAISNDIAQINKYITGATADITVEKAYADYENVVAGTLLSLANREHTQVDIKKLIAETAYTQAGIALRDSQVDLTNAERALVMERVALTATHNEELVRLLEAGMPELRAQQTKADARLSERRRTNDTVTTYTRAVSDIIGSVGSAVGNVIGKALNPRLGRLTKVEKYDPNGNFSGGSVSETFVK